MTEHAQRSTSEIHEVVLTNEIKDDFKKNLDKDDAMQLSLVNEPKVNTEVHSLLVNDALLEKKVTDDLQLKPDFSIPDNSATEFSHINKVASPITISHVEIIDNEIDSTRAIDDKKEGYILHESSAHLINEDAEEMSVDVTEDEHQYDAIEVFPEVEVEPELAVEIAPTLISDEITALQDIDGEQSEVSNTDYSEINFQAETNVIDEIENETYLGPDEIDSKDHPLNYSEIIMSENIEITEDKALLIDEKIKELLHAIIDQKDMYDSLELSIEVIAVSQADIIEELTQEIMEILQVSLNDSQRLLLKQAIIENVIFMAKQHNTEILEQPKEKGTREFIQQVLTALKTLSDAARTIHELLGQIAIKISLNQTQNAAQII
jgi:hypothetical protein